MSKLALKTEEIRILSSDEMDYVAGGLHKTSSAHPGHKISSVFNPTSTARTGGSVSSALNPTATAVSSAKPGHGKLSSAKPNF